MILHMIVAPLVGSLHRMVNPTLYILPNVLGLIARTLKGIYNTRFLMHYFELSLHPRAHT